MLVPRCAHDKESTMNASAVFKWILVATPLMVGGCKTGSNVTPIGGTVEPGGGGGGQGALLVDGTGNYEAPPHVFSPRPHPAPASSSSAWATSAPTSTARPSSRSSTARSS